MTSTDDSSDWLRHTPARHPGPYFRAVTRQQAVTVPRATPIRAARRLGTAPAQAAPRP